MLFNESLRAVESAVEGLKAVVDAVLKTRGSTK